MPTLPSFPARRGSTTHNMSAGRANAHRTTESGSQLSLTDHHHQHSSHSTISSATLPPTTSINQQSTQASSAGTFVAPSPGSTNNWEDKLMNSFLRSIKDKVS